MTTVRDGGENVAIKNNLRVFFKICCDHFNSLETSNVAKMNWRGPNQTSSWCVYFLCIAEL